MANIKTKEQLQLLFEERKRIQQRKKEIEKKRYKRLSESTKKLLMKKNKAEHKQTPPEPQKLTYFKLSINIYSSPLIEREPRDEDLYTTREEIMNDPTGEINWNVWDRLVEEFHRKNYFSL